MNPVHIAVGGVLLVCGGMLLWDAVGLHRQLRIREQRDGLDVLLNCVLAFLGVGIFLIVRGCTTKP